MHQIGDYKIPGYVIPTKYETLPIQCHLFQQQPCPPNYTYQKPANYQMGGYGNGFGGNGFPNQINRSQQPYKHDQRNKGMKSKTLLSG